MTESGLVTIILPCYNAERFVAAAVQSLLNQSYRRLQIVAIDDGSSDGTRAILESFAKRDDRIAIFGFDRNQGLIAALNAGLEAASGEFIARMDADDIADPTKIERQVAFLNAHPDLDLIGCGMREIRMPRPYAKRAQPVRCVQPAGARFMGLLGTPLAHVTIVARSSIMSRYRYSVEPTAISVEDYELFARMLRDGVRIGNLDLPLLTRRLYDAGASLSNERQQIDNFLTCARQHLEQDTGLTPPSAVHRTLTNRMDRTVRVDDLRAGLRLLGSLERRALASSPESRSDIRRAADLQRVDILSQAILHGRLTMRVAAVITACRRIAILRSPHVRAYLASKIPGALLRGTSRETANSDGRRTVSVSTEAP